MQKKYRGKTIKKQKGSKKGQRALIHYIADGPPRFLILWIVKWPCKTSCTAIQGSKWPFIKKWKILHGHALLSCVVFTFLYSSSDFRAFHESCSPSSLTFQCHQSHLHIIGVEEIMLYLLKVVSYEIMCRSSNFTK